MPLPPTAAGSAEEQNKYQERHRHKASNLVCREAAHGAPRAWWVCQGRRTAAPPSSEMKSSRFTVQCFSGAPDRKDSTPPIETAALLLLRPGADAMASVVSTESGVRRRG